MNVSFDPVRSTYCNLPMIDDRISALATHNNRPISPSLLPHHPHSVLVVAAHLPEEDSSAPKRQHPHLPLAPRPVPPHLPPHRPLIPRLSPNNPPGECSPASDPPSPKEWHSVLDRPLPIVLLVPWPIRSGGARSRRRSNNSSLRLLRLSRMDLLDRVLRINKCFLIV